MAAARAWPPRELEREAARRGCSSSRWSGACASLGVFRRHETCTVAQVFGGRVLGEAEDAEHLLQIPPKTSKGAQREKSRSTFRPRADARADCCASAHFIPRLPCGAPPPSGWYIAARGRTPREQVEQENVARSARPRFESIATRTLAGSRSGLSSGGTLGGQRGLAWSGSVAPWPMPTAQETCGDAYHLRQRMMLRVGMHRCSQ